MFLGAKYILHSLLLWDYKHSQEVVVHSSVDINTMNMLASYLHILHFAHMDFRLCKQMLKVLLTALMQTCSPTHLSRDDTHLFLWSCFLKWRIKWFMKWSLFCKYLLKGKFILITERKSFQIQCDWIIRVHWDNWNFNFNNIMFTIVWTAHSPH